MAEPDYKGGILRVASASEVMAAQEASDREKLDQESPEILGLVAYLKRVWETNKQHKISSGIQDQLLANQRARDSEYDPGKLTKIRELGGSEIYMGLTAVKCGHAESWLIDIFSSSEPSWTLQPTPVPDPSGPLRDRVTVEVQKRIAAQISAGQEMSPDDIAKLYDQLPPMVEEVLEAEAKLTARKMNQKITDQLVEARFEEVFGEFVADFASSKAGIIKGPLFRKCKRRDWVISEKTGDYVEKVTSVLKPFCYRVSPLDFFPSPESSDPMMGDMVERLKLYRRDLVDLKQEKGYDAMAINSVLEEFAMKSGSDSANDGTESQRAEIEDHPDTPDLASYDAEIPALEFWVSVQGKMLRDYGLEKDWKGKPLEDLDEYDINAILVDDTIIYLDFNKDALLDRPYSIAGWDPVPGSFWYTGVPEKMEDLQQVCNAACRSLVNNMAYASGPQAEVDLDRLVAGTDPESIFPTKVWPTENNRGATAPAVRFFQPDSNAPQLLQVYDRFAQLADDYTGIPAYAYGNDRVAGAGRTSSGLSMLMSSASKGIKRAILRIDQKIIRPIILRLFDYNMKHDKDTTIKGDLQIVTSGAVALMVREQMNERRMGLLNSTNNPVDMKLTGLEGRATMLREAVASTEVDPNRVVRSVDKIKQIEEEDRQAELQASQAQTAQQQQLLQIQVQEAQAKLQTAQAKVEEARIDQQIRAAELQLKREELQLKAIKTRGELANKTQQTRAKLLSASSEALTKGANMLTESAMTEGEENVEAQPGIGGSAGEAPVGPPV